MEFGLISLLFKIIYKRNSRSFIIKSAILELQMGASTSQRDGNVDRVVMLSGVLLIVSSPRFSLEMGK